jgi:hypothetical protein
MANPKRGRDVSSTIQARNREYADNMEDNNAILFWMKKRGTSALRRRREDRRGGQLHGQHQRQLLRRLRHAGDRSAADVRHRRVRLEAVLRRVVISGSEKRQNSGKARR